MRAILLSAMAASLALMAGSCSQPSASIYNSVSYSDTALWYSNGREPVESLPDVFYILPTCVFDWADSLGNVHHNANPYDPGQRKSMEPSYMLADRIFADSANFFAPYYRQATLESWSLCEDSINARFAVAYDDIDSAFGYYIRHLNNGRPFVLAGFSQGGKGVVELIKHIGSACASRMIAAYVCGYKVTETDTGQCRLLRPASGPDDTGVCIVYNTVADSSANCPAVSDGNVFVINPASWTADTLWHSVCDSVDVRIDPVHNSLIASGIDPDACYMPELSSLFKRGNLHLMELTLYESLLRENVKLRSRSFAENSAPKK